MEMVTTGSEMSLMIALGVVSGFAFLVLIVTLSLMFFIRRKSRKSTKDADKERVEDPTPSASATEVARENPYTSLPHIGTGQGWLIVNSHTLGGIFTAVKREAHV